MGSVTYPVFPTTERPKKSARADRFCDWYFKNVWLGRLLVSIPLGGVMTLIQLEICARAYTNLLP